MAKGFGSSGSGFRGGGSSRGSYGARGNSGGRGNSRSTRGSGTSSAKGNTSKPKGQVRDGKSVQYSIKNSKGKTTYIGTTNNPTRRASEHRESGKLGRNDKLIVETRPTTKKSAEKVESAKLHAHRANHGRNPKHNTTRDGKFHQPPLF